MQNIITILKSCHILLGKDIKTFDLALNTGLELPLSGFAGYVVCYSSHVW